jgi:hypothetical protein
MAKPGRKGIKTVTATRIKEEIMVVTTLTDAQLRKLAENKEKKRGYKVHLILPVAHQGAVITVTEIHDAGISRGNKIVPILAQVWVFFADTNFKNGKTVPGYHIEGWDDYPILGTAKTPAEYAKAVSQAKVLAYDVAQKIAQQGYHYKMNK